jgi:hypothetical protein
MSFADKVIHNGLNTYHYLTGNPTGIGLTILCVLLMLLADVMDRIINSLRDWKVERAYRAWNRNLSKYSNVYSG